MIKRILRIISMAVMAVSSVWLAWCFWYILLEGKVIVGIEPCKWFLIFEVIIVTLGALVSPWIIWRFIKDESRQD